MTTSDTPLDSDEDLFEDAPCGYVACRPDGTITRVNRTFSTWTGLDGAALTGRHFNTLLSPAGRIYYETHYAPLLRMQGTVREIAMDIVRADGTRMPCLLNSTLVVDPVGQPRSVRTAIFDARDRRSYEQELLDSRRREQQIALELQRSLLSGELPGSDEVGIDLYYRPATNTLEVGGDWYDAFWTGPRSLALVVGDVVGRGIKAAASMGQLRSAIRALALIGMSPARLLETLDAFTERHRSGLMTTVAYMELRLDERRAVYAVAGHPPPLLWDPGRPTSFLHDGRSTPLGASFASRSDRPQATVELAEQASIALYTDGLVERRDEPITDGLDRLRTVIDAKRPDVVAAEVAHELRNQQPDDQCLMILSLR